MADYSITIRNEIAGKFGWSSKKQRTKKDYSKVWLLYKYIQFDKQYKAGIPQQRWAFTLYCGPKRTRCFLVL
jgi:hypothetical protein